MLTVRLLLFCSLVFAPRPAVGATSTEPDKATARALAKEAWAALDRSEHARAAELFDRAERLYHAPTMLLGLARARAGLGQLVAAHEAYQRILHEKLPEGAPEPFVKAVESARAEVGDVERRIGWVTILVVGPRAPAVVLDGATISTASLGVPRAVDPGDHVVRASAAGFAPAEQRFALAPGGKLALELGLTAAPEPVAAGTGEGTAGSRSALRITGFVAIGVGAAGVLAGAVSGGIATASHGRLVESCPDERCPESERGTLETYELTTTLSTVGLIAGGALAATGLVLVLVAPADQAPANAADPSATVSIGPARLAATIRF
jgi:hypothetical protein